MTTTNDNWNPGTYGRFRGLRLRPAIDLLAQVPADLPPGPVIDLGCGDGAVGPALARRFPDRSLIGLDSSAAMLAEAEATGAYHRLDRADIATWQPDQPPALIFSNAALQWLGDHDRLLPRLAGMLSPGGVLAVQMPGQGDAPSHRLARQVEQDLWDRTSRSADPVRPPVALYALLAGFGVVDAWETSYVQRLDPVPLGHPVRRFTESTYLLPILADRDADQRADFLRAYDAALDLAYPPLADGGVLFPFRRVFLILIRA